MARIKIIAAAALIACAAYPLAAETIFLTDGSILTGKIVRESRSETTVRISDGKTRTVPSSRIMRTIFYDLYTGKIFVNKTDGTILEAYMVDEDQKHYTFRKELYKPEEFKVKREDVLFIARKNPTNLAGELRENELAVKWNPPFNKIRSYRVYLRTGGGEYALFRETSSTKCVIGNLQGNKTYGVKVTAVDTEGYESLPSNEITAETPNAPPSSPAEFRLETKSAPASGAAEGRSPMTAKLTWKEASDADGKVLSYNVYEVKKGQYRLVTSTNLTHAEITGLDPGVSSYFIVRAVDDRKAESDNSRKVRVSSSSASSSSASSSSASSSSASEFAVSAAPCFIAPMGSFSRINGNGFGGRVTVMSRGVIADMIGAGLSFEFWRFEGGESDVRSSTMIPLTAVAECRFRPWERFSIAPELCAGYSYNRTEYNAKKFYPDGFREGTLTKTSFEPIAAAGLGFEILITERLHAGLGVRCGALLETGGLQRFAAAECSFGLTF